MFPKLKDPPPPNGNIKFGWYEILKIDTHFYNKLYPLNDTKCQITWIENIYDKYPLLLLLEKEIALALKNFKSSRVCRPDGIENKDLKILSDSLT